MTRIDNSKQQPTDFGDFSQEPKTGNGAQAHLAGQRRRSSGLDHFRSLDPAASKLAAAPTLPAQRNYAAQLQKTPVRSVNDGPDPQKLEELAERYAETKNLDKAVEIGLERKALGFATADAEVAFGLKLGAWAEANEDFLVARDIYLSGKPNPKNLPPNTVLSPSDYLDENFNFYEGFHFNESSGVVGSRLYLKEPRYQDAFIELYRDPRRWIEVAKKKMQKGDLLSAEKLLHEARGNNDMTVVVNHKAAKDKIDRVMIFNVSRQDLANVKTAAGTPQYEWTKRSQDRDPEIQKEIALLQSGIDSYELDAELILQQRVDKKEFVGAGKKRLDQGDVLKQKRSFLRILEFPKLMRDYRAKMSSPKSMSAPGELNWSAVENELVGDLNRLRQMIMQKAEIYGKLTPRNHTDAEIKKHQKKIAAVTEILKRGIASANEVLQAIKDQKGDVLRNALQTLCGNLPGLESLSEGSIAHANVDVPIHKARLLLAGGFFGEDEESGKKGNEKCWQEGLEMVEALKNYQEQESQKVGSFYGLAEQFPEGSPLVFIDDSDPDLGHELDTNFETTRLKKERKNDLRAASALVTKDLQIFKTLDRMKKKSALP
ncbi:MAG TPA: hypothetical protein DF383_11815, partial [Deltaproteobacteria bacterium]|nr:hypothetical protein [Deltaproteobacteria bacterium]